MTKNSTQPPRQLITRAVEFFPLEDPRYGEVTLVDCNDSFTHNLVQAFLTLGAPVRTFRKGMVTFDDIYDQIGSYVVLSPGPGKPKDATIAVETYERLKGSLPILGICLGMQVINEVHGGTTLVYNPPVHGKTSAILHNGNSIFENVESPMQVARYHSLKVVINNPEIETLSIFEDIPMAIRIAPQTVGVQFHPESFLTISGLKLLSNFLEDRI